MQIKRVMSAVLAGTGLYVGLWAAFWPERFFDSFPGFGRHWVAAMPPYNEHLVRDVGGMYLALAVISIWAVLRPRAETFAVTGIGWLVFNLLHAGFHLMHTDVYGTADVVLNAVVLIGVTLLSLALLVPATSGREE